MTKILKSLCSLNYRLLKKIVLIVIIALPLTVFAQDSLNVRFVGGYPFGNSFWMTGGTVNGHDYVFFNSGSSVIILNVDEPANPVKIGHIFSPIAMNPFLVDTLLYCAAYDRGLLIYNVSNPAQPILLGQCITPYPIWDIFVQDSLGFGIGVDSMPIFNVADPLNPTIISTWHQPDGGLRLIHVRGDYAYITAMRPFPYDGTLYIVDVSNPDSAVLASQLNYFFDPYDVTVSGNYMYINEPQLCVVDIADPVNPFVVGCFYFGPVYGYMGDMHIEDNYLYSGCSPFKIIDISNPQSPFVVGATFEGGVSFLAKIGDYVYGTFRGINVFDVSEPQLPFLVTEYHTYHYLTRVKVSGNLAIVSDYDQSGIKTINITDPQDCYELDYFKINRGSGAWTPEFEIQNNYVYVAALDSGLRILNISDPANIIEQGHCYAPDSAWIWDLFVRGDYAYIAGSKNYGFGIANVSNPSNPYFISGIPWQDTFQIHDVFVVGDYAYCGADDGLRIIDVSNQYNPYSIAKCSVAVYCDKIFVSGNYAYLGSPLRVIDVSDLYNPFLVAEHLNISVKGIHISGNYAYIAGDGVRVWDVSDPTNCQEVGYYTARFMAGYGVYFTNGYIYLAAGTKGLWILDFYGMDINEKLTRELPAKLTINTIGKNIKFSYELKRHSRVKICLIDVCGRITKKSITNESPGKYSKEIKGKDLCSGVYFLQIETSEYNMTEKIILLK
jgi:hypothetical protein